MTRIAEKKKEHCAVKTFGAFAKKILTLFLTLSLLLYGYYRLWFLRQPSRAVPADPSAFVSPADGVVSAVAKWHQDSLEIDKGWGRVALLTGAVADSGWIVSIHMDVTNVHYQRAPTQATLLAERYEPGKFLNALRHTNRFGFRPENEHNALLFVTPDSIRYSIVQVAGLLARRIVDYVEPGQQVVQGEIIGLIKLGSQVSLILPMHVRPVVRPGQRVVDGETIVARK